MSINITAPVGTHAHATVTVGRGATVHLATALVGERHGQPVLKMVSARGGNCAQSALRSGVSLDYSGVVTCARCLKAGAGDVVIGSQAF